MQQKPQIAMEEIKISKKTTSLAESLGVDLGACPRGMFVRLKADGRAGMGNISSVISQIREDNPEIKLKSPITFSGGVYRAYISHEES